MRKRREVTEMHKANAKTGGTLIMPWERSLYLGRIQTQNQNQYPVPLHVTSPILGLTIFAAIRHLLLADSISSSDFCILGPIHSLPQPWAAMLRFIGHIPVGRCKIIAPSRTNIHTRFAERAPTMSSRGQRRIHGLYASLGLA